jgi:hypothetical protein
MAGRYSERKTRTFFHISFVISHFSLPLLMPFQGFGLGTCLAEVQVTCPLNGK